MDGEETAVVLKTNTMDCQTDVDKLARLYYACAISDNEYGTECESFNNFLTYFAERWSNVPLPPVLNQGEINHGEKYPRRWRSLVWRWNKKPVEAD